MKWYAALLFLASCIWAALGESNVSVGLWGTLFIFSVLLPHVWRAHQLLVPVGYLATLVILWTRDQWVLVALSALMAVLSVTGI